MWKRREIFGALGAGAAGLTLIAGNNAARAQSVADDHKHVEMNKKCCNICDDCARACNEAFHHCVEQAAGGKARHAKVAQVVADCAAFCTLSATMIGRDSAMMMFSCRACADACRQCARECEPFIADPAMKQCFDACTRCEESCRNMVKAMGQESSPTR
jgi:hypothetical protein